MLALGEMCFEGMGAVEKGVPVSTCLELTIWAPAAPGKFFEPGKFATHLIFLHLFTFKMLTIN